jgi:hypothetical protein
MKARKLIDQSHQSTNSWEDAKRLIGRDGPADDATMGKMILSTGEPIFDYDKKEDAWYANASKSKTVRTAYDLAGMFTGENGGPITHQMVAMFSYAVDADKAVGMPTEDKELITGGFEDISPEAKAQKQLGKKYPNIQAAILSFF